MGESWASNVRGHGSRVVKVVVSHTLMFLVGQIDSPIQVPGTTRARTKSRRVR